MRARCANFECFQYRGMGVLVARWQVDVARPWIILPNPIAKTRNAESPKNVWGLAVVSGRTRPPLLPFRGFGLSGFSDPFVNAATTSQDVDRSNGRLLGLKGRNITAQGNALGTISVETVEALKGRNKNRCCALSGLAGYVAGRISRALPWAVL